MKASEYIERLQSLVAEHGDLPVVVLDDRGGYEPEIQETPKVVEMNGCGYGRAESVDAHYEDASKVVIS